MPNSLMKGQWQIHGSYVYGPDPERKLVCQVLNACGPEDSGEFDQKLRLIATAPDLLEALKNCVDGLGCQPGYVNTLALSIARSAIAAAEGVPSA